MNKYNDYLEKDFLAWSKHHKIDIPYFDYDDINIYFNQMFELNIPLKIDFINKYRDVIEYSKIDFKKLNWKNVDISKYKDIFYNRNYIINHKDLYDDLDFLYSHIDFFCYQPSIIYLRRRMQILNKFIASLNSDVLIKLLNEGSYNNTQSIKE